MNASERAIGLKLSTKIATVVNLFKTEFPDVKADLKPWLNDPDTKKAVDPDSIDIGFHFPGWSPRYQSRSILVQIRFYHDLLEDSFRLIGVDTIGFNHQGQAWRFSTVDQWQCEGKYQPHPEVSDKLKRFAYHVFEVFKVD
jgi:hypothetical protein